MGAKMTGRGPAISKEPMITLVEQASSRSLRKLAALCETNPRWRLQKKKPGIAAGLLLGALSDAHWTSNHPLRRFLKVFDATDGPITRQCTCLATHNERLPVIRRTDVLVALLW
jgi:putative intracellular protease/amidase